MIRLLILILFAFVMNACTSPEQEILGNWKIVRSVWGGEEDSLNNNPITELRFLKGGEFWIYRDSIPEVKGTYEIRNDSIYVLYKERFSPKDSLTWAMELENDILFLKKSDMNYSVLVPSHASAETIQEALDQELTLLKRNQIRDIRDNLAWIPFGSSEIPIVSVNFHDGYIWYAYGNCGHIYEKVVKSDSTLDLIWGYSEGADCISEKRINLDFLQSNYISKNIISPRRGNKFATYRRVSKNLMQVEYYFPEWVKEVNSTVGDSIYPRNLKLLEK